jgi:hypothetical protein
LENNNAEEFVRRIDKLAAGLGEFAKTGNQKLFKLIMTHYGRAIIPLITLQDGGRARGRFAGVLRQLGINLPPQIVRDRTLLSGEMGKIEAKEINAGMREGFSVRRTRVSAELEVAMTRVSHQKMYPRIKNIGALHQEVMRLLRANMGVKTDARNQ